MDSNDLTHFIFHGNAMPFGGRVIEKENRQLLASIPSPPAAALSVAGGLSSAKGGRAEHFGAFRWRATLAEAKGELLANGHYETVVTSSISDSWAKNDPFVFQADLLRITMISDHAGRKPASIRIREAVFGDKKGIFLDGDRVEVERNEDLNDAPTLDEFDHKYRTDRDFFNRHQDPLNPGSTHFGDPMPRTSGGYISTSIVHRIRWRNQVFEGNMLSLTGFGTIFFGEVLMNLNNRRITMVRLAMGSALKAEVALAGADPNGTWSV
jgi:hypothetical protein